jgi:LmbE family N-acetylglucosaminyl deacetylase
MAVAYILAHFDDEYGALPLIRQAQAASEPQFFLHVADYATPDVTARRLAETRAYVAHLGLDPASVEHVGAGSGVLDGAIHKGLADIYPRLKARLAELGPLDRLVTPAWEGGHPDHDSCAALTVALAAELGVPVIQQLPLYNGEGLAWRLFRSARPLSANGPAMRPPLSAAEARAWAFDVRFFPSQTKTWVGLWPMMFLTIALHGWQVQRLDPARVRERPHAGPLYYERVYKVAYEEVQAAVDALFTSAPGPS